MANVQYRLSTRVVNGQAEVMMRFYASRTLDQRAHTRVYVPVHLWNEKKQRLNTSTRYVTAETATAAELQALGITSEPLTAAQACLDYIGYKQLAGTTRAHYEFLAKTFNRFAEQYRTIYMNTLSVQDIEDLRRFLYIERAEGRSRNTVVSRLRKFRAVCYWAVRKGILDGATFSTKTVPA